MHHICTECGQGVEGNAGRKTCSATCRSKRSKRLRRIRLEAENSPAVLTELDQARELVRTDATEVAHAVMKEELRPVVREAITEDVLTAVSGLVKLTPRVVELIESDMESADSMVRQRAYTLVAKYTMGNAPIVAGETNADKEMHVTFNLPRPGEAPAEDHVPHVEAVELRSCDSCNQDKPTTEFVANSRRCRDCYDELRADVLARFGDGA